MSEWELTKLNGEYCIRWYEIHEGRKVRRRYRLGTKDRREAQALGASRYAELTRPSDDTVATLWEAYRLDKEGKSVVTTMKYTGRAVLPVFGRLDADSVTVEACRAYTQQRRSEGKSDGSIHTELGHLAIVMNWAAKRRFIDRAPYIEKPPKPDPKIDHFTRAEIQKMMDADVAPHIKLAIRLMMGTGARLSAALDLTWDRVDFNNGQIHLRNPFIRRRVKGRAIAPMSQSLREALTEAYHNRYCEYVIEFNGSPVRRIATGLRAVGRKTGIKQINAHKFRHTAAVWLAEDGHSMDEIAQFLGHSNPSMTYKVYARFSPDHMAGLAATLEM